MNMQIENVCEDDGLDDRAEAAAYAHDVFDALHNIRGSLAMLREVAPKVSHGNGTASHGRIIELGCVTIEESLKMLGVEV